MTGAAPSREQVEMAQQRHREGLCPCCGEKPEWYGEPVVIGEGVRWCVRCDENHPGGRALVLTALTAHGDAGRHE